MPLKRMPPQQKASLEAIDEAMEYLLDPVHGSASSGKVVCGVVCLHVDSFLWQRLQISTTRSSSTCTNTSRLVQKITTISSSLDNGSAGCNMARSGACRLIRTRALANCRMISLYMPLPPSLHTAFRSALGQVNWLQSRTQFQVRYSFSRRAPCPASPTTADLQGGEQARQILERPTQLS